jgi:hypothetical protein
MTKEKIRIAIAKACGWRGISEQFLVGYAPSRPVPYEQRILGNIEDIPLDPLPDYLNDLNAMHEAEKKLDLAELLVSYANKLANITTEARGFDARSYAFVADASQRAKAFLCALNLWENKP